MESTCWKCIKTVEKQKCKNCFQLSNCYLLRFADGGALHPLHVLPRPRVRVDKFLAQALLLQRVKGLFHEKPHGNRGLKGGALTAPRKHPGAAVVVEDWPRDDKHRAKLGSLQFHPTHPDTVCQNTLSHLLHLPSIDLIYPMCWHRACQCILAVAGPQTLLRGLPFAMK